MVDIAPGIPLDLSNLSQISPDIASGIIDIIFIIKAIGIILLIYIIFLIISAIMNIIRNIRIKRIYEKVYEMDSKLNILLESDKSKSELLKKLTEKKLTEEKHSKKSFFSFLFDRKGKSKKKK